MPRRFFITGTDTGVGKTVVSALLCAALEATYWKPVQTGSLDGTDRRTVMDLSEFRAYRTAREIYCFSPPVSPHLAAHRAGVTISIPKIATAMRSLSGSLIVEGAGGVLVPLTESELMIDLMGELRLPILLTARTSLGTINHTLLSLAALLARDLDVRGVILVGKPDLENHKAIEKYGRVAVVGTVPILDEINRLALLKVFRERFDHQFFPE